MDPDELNDVNFDSQFGGLEEENDDEEEDPFDNLFADNPQVEDDDDDTMGSGKSHRGTFVGTPLYASPEMLDDSVSGPFTDLWALGVIVYQLVSGELPWKGN